MFLVYKITNTINQKIYIGFTGRTLEQRWKSQLSAARCNEITRFCHAIRKYGPDPWKREILAGFSDEIRARKTEEDLILTENAMNPALGYNAKPGGCGGWIVPDDKYEMWRKKLSDAGSGERNSNYKGTSNEKMIELAIECSKELGYVCSHHNLIEYAKKKNCHIPKSFSQYRSFKNYIEFANHISRLTGLSHEIYRKTKQHRKKISDHFVGGKWLSNHDLKISKTIHRDRISEFIDKGWVKGRLYGNKNRKT